MPEGECTVTLQDVNIISGLPINSRAITGRVSGQWIQMIYDFLGHQLDVESTDIKGSPLKLRWLNETFISSSARGLICNLLFSDDNIRT
ncbi:hypothetical protein LINPERPRIM_LOCUS6179 [Linum perenne]